jgi:mannose-6-phosphate isomerase-like protein (cupin superfamily)
MRPPFESDYEGGYAKALAQAGVGNLQGTENAQDADGPGAIAGMHQTDTVDIVTIISGEIWAVVETGETLVRAGDTVIQRGTWHAWRNRSDAPCTVAPCTVAPVHISVVR